jgi:hypothetical protein
MGEFFADQLENKQGKRFMLALGIVAAVMVIAGQYRNYKLNKSHKVAEGRVTDCYWFNGHRSASNYRMKYLFTVNQKQYAKEAGVPCTYLSESLLKKKMVGLHLPVIYNPNDPDNNYLLALESTYKEYDMVMPDSLKWVNSFLNCK